MSGGADAPTVNGCISIVPALIKVRPDHLEARFRQRLVASPEHIEHAMSAATQEQSALANALLVQAAARPNFDAHSRTLSPKALP